MVFQWTLSDSKSPQVSMTLLSILAVLNNAVAWMVSTRPPTSKSSSPFNNPLVTVPKAQITMGIIVTFIFHSFFNSLARLRYLSFFLRSFNFILWSAETAKSTILQILFLLIITSSSNVGDRSRGRSEGSLFNSYYTEMEGSALLLSLECSTLLLICTLYYWELSKELSSTIFCVFGMTRPGIEPRSPGPLVNTYCRQLTFTFIRSGLLAVIRWSVCMSKSQRSLCVSFSRTNAGLCIYHLFVWSNLNFLHISQWITLSIKSCLVLYAFCANLLHSLIWLMVLSLPPHSLRLLFCCVLSILALIC